MALRTYSIILILIVMMQPPVSVSSQLQDNFTMRIIIPSDDLRFNGMGTAITQYWNSLFVNVEISGITRPIYQSKLLADDQEWDAAIVEYDYDYDNDPIIREFYAPETGYGKRILKLDDTILEGRNATSMDNFFSLVSKYNNATVKEEKISISKDLQRIYNEEILLEIPLVSTPLIIASWDGFAGFDLEEDLIHSIMLGARWDSVPEQRSTDKSDKEINYPLMNGNTMAHPLYSLTRTDKLIIQSLYSSLFIEDKYNEIHPNLATGYTHSTNNGSEWIISIRDDILWSDGIKLTAKDLKFTIDMNSFEWVQAPNSNKWRYLENIEILNDTAISLSFSKSTADEKNLLSSTYIFPEHIYNTSFTSDGDEYLPYEGGYPNRSPEWVALQEDPVTAGPYILDSYTSSESINLLENPNFWFPNEETIDGNLDLNSNKKVDTYYFRGLTSLGINKINFLFSDRSTINENSEQILFETAKRDFLEFIKMEESSNYLTNEDFKINILEKKNAGFKLVFNSKNEDVKKYEIRRALALSLNYKQILGFLGIGYSHLDTIVSSSLKDYYDSTYQIINDYDTARDIFKSNGLQAFESTDAFTNDAIDSINFLTIIISLFSVGIFIRKRVIR